MEQKKETGEIFPNMSVEEIKALFFDTNALKEPPYRIYQLNTDGYRYYYRFDEKGEPQFYPSVTTMLSAVMPTSPYLIEWMIKNGKEGAEEKRDMAAMYGTFMHSQFEEVIINRRYDFDEAPEKLRNYLDRENLPDKVFNDWLVKIRKDVLAFAQFVKDYNVRPLAVEIGLVHPKYNYAGCVDMPCIMKDPKTKEDFRAIVDFKSGRKGFYEEHELQLALYTMMWNVNFPDVKIDRFFNFSPKDWRSNPSYNLKEQTKSKNIEKIPHLLALAAIEDEKRDNTITVVKGVLDLDNGKLEDNILELSLSELIKSKKSEDTPEQAANAPAITEEEIKIAEKALGINDKSESAEETSESKENPNNPNEPILKPSDEVSGNEPIVDTPKGEKSDSTANSKEIKGNCQYFGEQCFCVDCDGVFDTRKKECYDTELKAKYMPNNSLLNDDIDM